MVSNKNFILYTTPNEEVKINVFLQRKTIWFTQKMMGLLFEIDRTVITKYLKNIFDSGELIEKMVCAKFAHTTPHGAVEGKTQTKEIKYYNLDAIISVGYRVNSTKATQFRIWATKTLREYIIKGFVVDDDRLKNNSKLFGKDYFDELLEKVRSIRVSERRIYQKIV